MFGRVIAEIPARIRSTTASAITATVSQQQNTRYAKTTHDVAIAGRVAQALGNADKDFIAYVVPIGVIH